VGVDFLNGVKGVNYDYVVFVDGGEFEEALADLLVVIFAFLFHAVGDVFEAFGGCGQVGIQYQCHIRPEPFERAAGEVYDFIDAETAGVALVCAGAGEPAVEDDAFALLEGGSDAFGPQLGAGGHIQKDFGAEVHLVVGGVEEYLSDLFADGGCAGVAEGDGLYAGGLEILGEHGGLGAFAAAVRAVKDNESAGHLFL